MHNPLNLDPTALAAVQQAQGAIDKSKPTHHLNKDGNKDKIY